MANAIPIIGTGDCEDDKLKKNGHGGDENLRMCDFTTAQYLHRKFSQCRFTVV